MSQIAVEMPKLSFQERLEFENRLLESNTRRCKLIFGSVQRARIRADRRDERAVELIAERDGVLCEIRAIECDIEMGE